MAMTIIEAPRLVAPPRSATPRVKMVANMVDMKKNTATNATAAILGAPVATTRHRARLARP